VEADMLVLTDGRVLEGQFVAGSESFIQFRTSDGIQSIPIEQISALHLRPAGDSVQAVSVIDSAVSPSPAAEPTALAAGAVVVPAGTELRLRFDKEVSTSSHKSGASFQAMLAADLSVQGQVVAAKGSLVQGRVAEVRGGKKLGTQVLKLALTSLSVHNQKVPLITGNFGLERGSGQNPRLVGAEQAAGSNESVLDLEEFVEGSDHVRVPRGAVLQVSLREPVALFP